MTFQQQPDFTLRVGFLPSSHGEIAPQYTQQQLAGAFHFRDIAAGPVPADDVLQADFTRDGADVYDRMTVGKGTFFLDNNDGRYSPASQAAYLPGKPISFTAVWSGSGGIEVKPMFTGRIVGYQTTVGLGDRVVRLEAEDRAAWLRRNIGVPMRLDTVTSSLAWDVLKASGFDDADIEVDANANDQIPFSLLDDMTGGEALDQLIKSGRHFAYVDGAGRVIFKARTFNLFATTVSSLTEFESFGYDLPLDRVINDVRITSQPRRVATDEQTVAFLEDVPTVPGSGGSLTIFLSWQDRNLEGQVIEQGVPVTSLTSPVPTIDWSLNSEADGLGIDLTGDAEVILQGFARSGIATIVNSSDSVGHLIDFNVRAYPVRLDPSFGGTSQDSASIAAIERRDFTIETQLIKTLAFAQAYADLILSDRKDPTPVIEVGLRNSWPRMLDIDMLDRITVQEAVTGINTAFNVRGIDHSITMNPGLAHTTRYRLEISDQRLYMVLDKDPEGKLDASRVLAP